MQSVFNVDIDQWFKKEKVEENIPEIIETILSKEPNIKDKNIKKNAYLSFQNTLLSFNSKEFWDSKNNKPNQLWINKIKNELTVLIHYKMITINQALSIIDKTLKIGDKISEFDRSTIRENILKKDELADWQNHLQKLLVKGAFWDSVSNAPTNDWIDAALTIAQAALTNNISLADELKNSFFKTINEKFTTIEEGKDIQNV